MSSGNGMAKTNGLIGQSVKRVEDNGKFADDIV